MPTMIGASSATMQGSNERSRLSTVLMGTDAKSFDSMVTLESNVQAIESALLFATGRTPFVALVGPSGWGKSHLVEAASITLQALDRSCRPQLVNAKEWPQVANRVDLRSPLLIDNAQEAVGQHKTRLQLRLTLERRVRAGRPTLLAFTATKPTRALRAFLPNHNAWVIATIEPPSFEERLSLVSQMSRSEGLHLSDSLRRILALHLSGDGRTLAGACKRLRLQDARWLDPMATLRALGLLNPFFADNSDWDLRETISEAIAERGGDARLDDMGAYMMVRVALLAESDVAHFLDIEPSVAYTRAQRFHQVMDRCEQSNLQMRQSVDRVIERLSTR